MRKIIFPMVALGFVLALGAVGRIESTYTMHGTIIDRNTVEDERGELWGYDVDIPNGTRVVIAFDNNNTDTNIRDDVVLSVKPA